MNQFDFTPYIGKTLDKDVTAEQIKTACGAGTMRVLSATSPMTMDLRPDRVNIIHDDKNVILVINMG